jgi:hypothetical protein
MFCVLPLSTNSIVFVSFPSEPISYTVAVFKITSPKALLHAVVTTAELPVVVELLVPVATLSANLVIFLLHSV